MDKESMRGSLRRGKQRPRKNVTLTWGEPVAMSTLPCWICGKTVDLRIDKNGKFYTVCNPCGAQSFVRREAGMKRLTRLMKHLKRMDYVFAEHAESLFTIQGILKEVAGLKTEIDRLESKAGYLFPDEELLRERDALQKRLDLLLERLEQLAEKQEINNSAVNKE